MSRYPTLDDYEGAETEEDPMEREVRLRRAHDFDAQPEDDEEDEEEEEGE